MVDFGANVMGLLWPDSSKRPAASSLLAREFLAMEM